MVPSNARAGGSESISATVSIVAPSPPQRHSTAESLGSFDYWIVNGTRRRQLQRSIILVLLAGVTVVRAIIVGEI